jgi:hypothetical protein
VKKNQERSPESSLFEASWFLEKKTKKQKNKKKQTKKTQRKRPGKKKGQKKKKTKKTKHFFFDFFGRFSCIFLEEGPGGAVNWKRREK